VTDSIALKELIIRPMELKDVARVHEIDVQSFNLPWPERSYLFELNENPASRLWVAESNDHDGKLLVVGMIVLWKIIDEAHIGTLAVTPEQRRKRIGERLLAKALLVAHAEGVSNVYLEVRRGNLAAQQLYRRFGFEVTGTRPRYYRDNGEDALMMTLAKIDPLKVINFT